jgi:hypothetical protein
MLGEKGVTGFIIGLGVSAFLAGFRSERGLGVLATVGALGASIIVTYGHLGKLLDITRNEKVHYFGWSAATILVIGIVLWWLGQSKAQEQVS